MHPETVKVTPVSQKDPAVERTNKLKLRWGLILLIGPSLLIPVMLVLYAVINFAFGGLDGPLKTITNILMFLGGALVIVGWLPAFIAGIILLASRK